MYKCTNKLKRKGLFSTIWVGETINEKTFDKLSDEEKTHFIEDKSDESFLDQFEENQKADDAADNQ